MLRTVTVGPHLLSLLLALIAASFAAPATASDSAGDSAAEPALRRALNALAGGSFRDRGAAAQALAAIEDDRVNELLSALADGQLYRDRRTEQVVFAERSGSGYTLRDPLTGADLGAGRRRDVRRVGVNNALRGQVEQLLAQRRLTRGPVAARAAAAEALIGTADPALLELLESRLGIETDESVTTPIQTALELATALGSAPEAERLAAIEALAGNPDPGVRAALRTLAEDAGNGDTLRRAAVAAEAATAQRLERLAQLETLFFGLSLGSVLVLAAIGLAITFGVMGVINMAHGELIMLGAYCSYVLQTLLPTAPGVALLLSVPAAFAVAGAIGMLIERSVIQHLYGRPLETLLATFGISLILQQAVRSIFSPLNRTVATPEFMSGSFEIAAGLSLTATRIYILGFSLTAFALVWLLLNRSRFGLAVRAVSQNRAMARSLGVRSERIDTLTFGLGAGVAGVAGVALSQLTNVGPNMGQAYIIDSFLVVVFGGVGNLWGTLVGGLSIGMLNKLLEPFAGAVLAKITVLIMVILFIQRRPQGLFPQRGRAAAD
ncbi:MAG: urea ABC transporter permease subunit UrtB [Pseudomonadota bacterium]